MLQSIKKQAVQQLLATFMNGQAWLAWVAGKPFVRKQGSPPLNEVPDLAQIRRVLVVRLNELGDMVMTTAFVRELRRRLPHAHITLVTTPLAAELFATCPYLDEVLAFDKQADGWRRVVKLPLRAWRFACRHLRPQSFDLALDPSWFADNSYATFLVYFSGARLRLGPDERATPRKSILNRGYNRLLTHPLPPTPIQHDVEQSFETLRWLGAEIADTRLELWTGADDEQYAELLLAAHDLPSAALRIALCPSGGNSRLKQWPPERFVELGRALRARYPKGRLLLVGGPEDRALCQTIADEVGEIANFAGQTSVRQLAALLQCCQAYVGCDCGPMHIAAATQIPVVGLFGSSCSHRCAPWGSSIVVRRELECSACRTPDHPERCKTCIYPTPHCMESIEVTEVMQAVEQALRLPRLMLLPLAQVQNA